MTGPLTLELHGADGTFTLCDADAEVHAIGNAVASKTRPGFVTLRFRQWFETYTGEPIRVPADWVSALEAAWRPR